MEIHHLALRVADCERSLAFYGGLLALPETRRRLHEATLDAVWLRAGDVVLMLERSLRGTGDDRGSGHLVAFRVEDLPSWERKLAAAGVAIADRTEHTLYVRDPDGHRVGLTVFPAGI